MKYNISGIPSHQWRRVILFFSLCSCSLVSAQEIALKGTVLDAVTGLPISGVQVELEDENYVAQTTAQGKFSFQEGMPVGEQVVVFSKEGYITSRLPVIIEEDKTKDLDIISLEPQPLPEEQQTGIISLADHELDEESGGFDNISGLLQATHDVFLNAAAFDFSPTFFRPRGLNSEDGKLLINGIEMNKLYNGRPQWSNWGGLNDVQRNQAFSMGIAASEVAFGGLAGTTNIIMRASQYNKGGKFSYASSNRAYSGRIMGSYHSGLAANHWAYSISLSRRFAEESFRDGSIYDANSVFLSVEKKISDAHSLNFTGFFTPNRRGKTSANTQEVYDLRDIRYNSYWGYQDGQIRNSRIKEVAEPILMLNYFWDLSEETTLNMNVAYQFGKVGNSRLDYGGSRLITGTGREEIFIGGGSNPDPAYYQKLPSYSLRFPYDLNYQAAYLQRETFQEDGQLDWNALYSSNQVMAAAGGNSVYTLYEDRNDDQQISANSIFRTELSENLVLNSKVGYQGLKSENFAEIIDLLGGTQYLDVDSFSEGSEAQNDLQNPNRLAGEGEKIKYHFRLDATVFDSFVQAQFKYKKFDFFTGGSLSHTTYSRTGFFQNGNFPNNSLGESPMLEFTNFGFKSGGTYKLSGRHLFTLNAGYFTRAPNLRNSFSNSRQNNNVVEDIESEKIQTADFTYTVRMPSLKARITGYYAEINDATEISFYYADGISELGRNATTAFVQEILRGIGKRNTGVEMGIEAQILPSLKLKGAAAIGAFTYHKNPDLYLTSDDFEDALHYGPSNLKNYKVAGGPQRAYQVGFEYRNPKYWFITASTNYFSHTFLDIAPLIRTRNFYTDADGLPFVNYDTEVAKNLLEQEQFDDYFLVNVIGGKSWRVKKYFIGFFASINNLLDTKHKTGGYEQSRNANYRTLKEDQDRDQPIFGAKYWYGYGTTYYAHVYVRF